MRALRRFLGSSSIVGALVALTSCTYSTRQHLPREEQAQLALSRTVMTPAQVRTSLAKGNAAERTAYLSERGLVQRFEALDPLDRDAVRNGFPRVGGPPGELIRRGGRFAALLELEAAGWDWQRDGRAFRV